MECVKLGDYCDITSSKRVFANQYVEKGVPFYRSREIIEKKEMADISEPLFISEELYETFRKKFGVPIEGDLLLTSVGTLGIPYIVKNERFYFKDGNLTWMKNFKKELSSKYLYYWLNSKFGKESLINRAIGSSQAALTIAILKKYKIFLPTLRNQNQIVDILSAFDNLIENNNKRIKILEQMAENLYKEWFVRFRFPDYQNTEFENGIPDGWRTVTLDSILSKIATGLNPRKNFVLGNGDNYYVTIKNMGDNNIYLDDRCDKVDDEAIIKINKRSDLRQGDLLFSGIGTIGRTYLINIPTNNWNISESVFTMRPKKIVSSEYLYMLLLSDDLQNYCQAKANGSAQKGIRMAVLRKYTFLLAPIAIIENFTKKARRILNLISLIREKNQNLTKQRDMLLPRLMSGKLEVK